MKKYILLIIMILSLSCSEEKYQEDLLIQFFVEGNIIYKDDVNYKAWDYLKNKPIEEVSVSYNKEEHIIGIYYEENFSEMIIDGYSYDMQKIGKVYYASIITPSPIYTIIIRR